MHVHTNDNADLWLSQMQYTTDYWNGGQLSFLNDAVREESVKYSRPRDIIPNDYTCSLISQDHTDIKFYMLLLGFHHTMTVWFYIPSTNGIFIEDFGEKGYFLIAMHRSETAMKKYINFSVWFLDYQLNADNTSTEMLRHRMTSFQDLIQGLDNIRSKLCW